MCDFRYSFCLCGRTGVHGFQRTPLHCAAKGDHPAIASYLLLLKADPEARTAYKMTPLHVAAFYGSCKVTKLLLEQVQGIDIDALDFGSCECKGKKVTEAFYFPEFSS